MDRLLIAQSRAMVERQSDFVGTKLFGEKHPRYFCIEQARASQVGLSEIDSRQIAVSEVGIGKIQPSGIKFPEVSTPIITTTQR